MDQRSWPWASQEKRPPVCFVGSTSNRLANVYLTANHYSKILRLRFGLYFELWYTHRVYRQDTLPGKHLTACHSQGEVSHLHSICSRYNMFLSIPDNGLGLGLTQLKLYFLPAVWFITCCLYYLCEIIVKWVACRIDDSTVSIRIADRWFEPLAANYYILRSISILEGTKNRPGRVNPSRLRTPQTKKVNVTLLLFSKLMISHIKLRHILYTNHHSAFP